MKEVFCKNIESCLVPKFYQVLGKKWAFPVFIRLEVSKDYSFEDIVRFTQRKIHRASISNLLKSMVKLGVLKHYNKKYSLTKKGKEIRKRLVDIGVILHCPNSCKTLQKNNSAEDSCLQFKQNI